MLLETVLPDTGQIFVIASAPRMPAWRTQLGGQQNARIFSETDFLVALDAIINERPGVVALDPMFAATARGAALVARVKADPRLRQVEVRTLVGDGLEMRELSATGEPDGKASIKSQPLDSCGTRRAPRYAMQPDVEAKVNGTACRLVNLSMTGSQIVAPIRLRPSEDIRLTFSDGRSNLRLAGVIAWISLEIAAKTNSQRYRFGVEFRDADYQALQQFCVRHREDS
jgi:hypothetical protein